MDKFSFLGSLDVEMIEKMYDDFLNNPKDIDHEWRNFFQGFDFAKEVYS